MAHGGVDPQSHGHARGRLDAQSVVSSYGAVRLTRWTSAVLACALIGVAMPVMTGAISSPALADGTTWTDRDASFSRVNWRSVTYGGGLFLAVSSGGSEISNGTRVMTSSDGVTWTRSSLAGSAEGVSVAYGGGRFVAVVPNGTAYSSADGITWAAVAQSGITGIGWRSVTYGNGRFVAVASAPGNPRTAYSTDGHNWTNGTSIYSKEFKSVAYGGPSGSELFVAVGDGGTVMTSPDGDTWTSQTAAASNNWESVTFGGGLFVAVSISGTGNRVMTSPDGVTWTSRSSAADNYWWSVAYGGGTFAAVSSDGSGSRVMTSTDGVTWTSRATPDKGWRGITYGGSPGNEGFVAVGDTGVVMTSGITGSAVTPAFDTPVRTTDGFTVDVTNYDASYSWNSSVDAGAVSAGTPSGSTLPLTVTGLTAGESATITMGTSRSGYSSGSGTVTGQALSTQVITWSPTTSITTAQSPLTPSSLATALGGAAISYSVISNTTTTCSVNPATGVLTYTGTGNCRVRAFAGATSSYESGSRDVAFVVSVPTPAPAPPDSGSGGSSNDTPAPSSNSTATTTSTAATAVTDVESSDDVPVPGTSNPTRGRALPPPPESIDVTPLPGQGRSTVLVRQPAGAAGSSVVSTVVVVRNARGKTVSRINVAMRDGQGEALVTVPFVGDRYTVDVYNVNDVGVSTGALVRSPLVKATTITKRANSGRPTLFGSRIGRPIIFSGGSAKLDARDRKRLRAIAREVKTSTDRLFVTGFARKGGGSQGELASLSTKRARAAAQYLSKQGVRVWIRYWGAGSLNGTGMASDRRVEVRTSAKPIPRTLVP